LIISAVIHLTLFVVVANVLAPRAGEQSSQLLVIAAFQDELPELIELDTTTTIAAYQGKEEQSTELFDNSLDTDLSIVDPTTLSAAADGQSDGSRNATPTISQSSGGQTSSSPGLVCVYADRPSRSRVRVPGSSSSRATFFGMTAYGDRFVYILDISTSMRRPSNGTTRFKTAAGELLNSISKLRTDQHFTVVLFCGETRQMFDSKSPTDPMIRATEENKRRLAYWLDEIELGPWTDPRRALRFSLSLSPSAIFLLSDGEFNRKRSNDSLFKMSCKDAFEVVDRFNTAKVPIHTVALEDPVNRRSLDALSLKTNGQHCFVYTNAPPTPPAPPPAKPKSRAKYWLVSARKLESQGKMKQAVMCYERAFKSGSRDSEESKLAAKRLEELSSTTQPANGAKARPTTGRARRSRREVDDAALLDSAFELVNAPGK